jgi:transcriptional regulator with XRE-family HTH domain
VRKLAGYRVTAGLTQTDVAAALGITQGAVSLWERGWGKPTLDKAQQLAELYGITAQDIVEACLGISHTHILIGKEALDNDGTPREHLQNMQK